MKQKWFLVGSAALVALALTAASVRAEAPGDEKKGGCAPAALNCCLPALAVPVGQVMNSGYSVPSRSYMKLIPVANIVFGIMDAVKAYKGETMAEYLGVEDTSKPATEEKKGGCGPAAMSCCLPGLGVPPGQMYNSTGKIPTSAWLNYLIGSIYSGYTAYTGQTLQEFCEIK